MKRKHPNKFKFAVIAADTVLFTVHNNKLKVLCIPVQKPPYTKDHWGVPGGIINPKETTEEAGIRYILEMGGVKPEYIEQLYTFSAVDRDPKGRVVSTAYLALAPEAKMGAQGESEAKWFPVNSLPKLAYDHKEIIKTAVDRLRAKLEYTNIAFALLPKEFTLGELQEVYEVVLGKKLDKRNFQKKLFSLKILKPLNKTKAGVPYRPPQLYSFKNKKLKTIEII